MKKENKTTFYSGRKNGRHENGVEFIVSEDALPQLKILKMIFTMS